MRIACRTWTRQGPARLDAHARTPGLRQSFHGGPQALQQAGQVDLFRRGLGAQEVRLRADQAIWRGWRRDALGGWPGLARLAALAQPRGHRLDGLRFDFVVLALLQSDLVHHLRGAEALQVAQLQDAVGAPGRRRGRHAGSGAQGLNGLDQQAPQVLGAVERVALSPREHRGQGMAGQGGRVVELAERTAHPAQESSIGQRLRMSRHLQNRNPGGESAEKTHCRALAGMIQWMSWVARGWSPPLPLYGA